MAKDENGLHIQTEQEYQTQLAHQLQDLGAGDAHELTDEDLANLQPPAWLAAARAAEGLD